MNARIRCLLPAAVLAAGVLTVAGCCTLGLRCAPSDAITVTAGKRLNSCGSSGDHAVTLRLYSLRDGDAFASAGFDRLWSDEGQKLGASLLGLKELTVMPGESVPELRLPRPEGTQALGIVADFCDQKSGCWKKVVKLDKGTCRIRVKIDGTCLVVEKK